MKASASTGGKTSTGFFEIFDDFFCFFFASILRVFFLFKLGSCLPNAARRGAKIELWESAGARKIEQNFLKEDAILYFDMHTRSQAIKLPDSVLQLHCFYFLGLPYVYPCVCISGVYLLHCLYVRLRRYCNMIYGSIIVHFSHWAECYVPIDARSRISLCKTRLFRTAKN